MKAKSCRTDALVSVEASSTSFTKQDLRQPSTFILLLHCTSRTRSRASTICPHVCAILKDPQPAPRTRSHRCRQSSANMPKFFCDYCDVYLTHDSMSVRKAHNSGRNHIRNVIDYYQQIGQERAQSVIDSITNSYAAEGQASSNPMLHYSHTFGGPGLGGGFPPGPPGAFPPGKAYRLLPIIHAWANTRTGMPPFPQAGRGMPPFPPQGFPPGIAPPTGFPPTNGIPPFPPGMMGQGPAGSPLSGPPFQAPNGPPGFMSQGMPPNFPQSNGPSGFQGPPGQGAPRPMPQR